MAGGRDSNSFLKLIEAPGSTENYFLSGVEGREALSEPFEYRLTARSQGEVPPASDWIGASITFTLSSSEGVERKINGQCGRFQHAYQKGNYVQFTLDLAPSLLSAKLRRDHRLFTAMSPKAVVATILKEHDVAFDDSKVTSSTVAEYIVQNDETDFDFVNRLMESEGVFYYFRYDENAGRYKHKMYMADQTSGYYDGSPFDLSFRRDHLLMGLRDLEMSYGATPGTVLTHDYNYKTPDDLSPISSPSKLDWAAKPGRVYAWSPGYAEAGQGRRRAQLAMEGVETEAIAMHGSGSYVAFAPGARFQVDDPRLKPRERRIVVRSVTHHAFNPASLSEGEPSYEQTFAAQPSAQVYRPPRRTSSAEARGPQTAVVVDQNDPEGFGRVKVRFHWDRAGASTAWVRLVHQWAGHEIGAQFIPRPGMEVMIDFLNGDASAPVVVGCLYNGKNKHPFALPGSLPKAGWRTRTHPDGGIFNELVFDDTPGAEEIYLSAGRNFRRKVAKDEIAEIGEDQTTKAGRDVVIDAGGKILLRVGDNRVEISAAGVSINGKLVKINS